MATAAAPALSLLTPWTLREHGALTPELLAPAVLLGAALLASRPRWAPAAGALAATAPFLKWPYALALIAIVLFSAAPRRAAVGAASRSRCRRSSSPRCSASGCGTTA